MTRKQYEQVIAQWNPDRVLYIRYRTRNTSGVMTISVAFFMEMYKKIVKLLKGVKIVEIFVKNENTQIVLQYFNDLYSTWIYGLGEHYHG